MNQILANSLYKQNVKRFQKLKEEAKTLNILYNGSNIIQDDIYNVLKNYVSKNDKHLELFRLPIQDDDFCAFTCIREGKLFTVLNSWLPISKQIFATAHELYHVWRYISDQDDSLSNNGSLLRSENMDDDTATREDKEANAFAGLLLMPDASVIEQFKMFGISKENMGIDDVLILMDLFALPYKAVVLRLVESGVITEEKARNLYQEKSESIAIRIELTGKAEQWQQNSGSLLRYGSLLDNLAFNSEHELLVDSREESDRAYLEKIGKEFRNRK